MRQAEAPVSPEELCRLLWQQAAECVWSFDLRGRLHWICGNTCPLFGKKPQNLLGAAWKRKLSKLLSGQVSLRRELLPDPSGAWFSVTHRPLGPPDARVRVIGGVARTVTPASSQPDAKLSQLAKFLHDDVGQNLSVAGLQLDLLRVDLGAGIPTLAARTDQIQDLLENLMQRIRQVSSDLVDGVGHAGIGMALERLVARMQVSFPGSLLLRTSSGISLGDESGAALYGAARLALEHAIRQPSCSRIEILLKSTPGGLAIEIHGRMSRETRQDASYSERDLGLLLLEEHAAQHNLGLWITLERDKGLLVKSCPRDESL